ncbi:MAG: hypothetical protein P4L36_10665 [Holophaga sp.]|nr:hypothetical protein [Holophaga sp.]
MTIAILMALMQTGLMAGYRAMASDDPNLDSGWDWRVSTINKLYSTAVGESPASEHSVLLPFFTNGNLLNTLPLDMDKEDGWVLVHRDFGVKEFAQAFPFFTLYNRYRGTFRVMLFNALARQESYYLGELKFMDGGDKNISPVSLLDFACKQKCFLNDFNPLQKITATTYMQAYGDWAVFDFPLLGYDPALEHSDPILCFQLIGVEFQKLSLEGKGNIDLMQRMQGMKVRPTIGTGDFVKAANTSLNYYRTPLNWMEELTNNKNVGKSWYKTAIGLSKTSAMSFVPWITALGGVVESFVGGANKSSGWEPLSFAGQLKLNLEGSLVLDRRLWAHNFHIKPGPVDAMAQRPLQAVPWGIFNVRSTPVIVENIQSLPGLGSKIYYYKLDSGGDIVVNPSLDMDLVSTEVALKFDRLLDKTFPPYGQGSSGAGIPTDTTEFVPFKWFSEIGFMKITNPANPIEIIYKLKFKTRQPTLNSDNEIVIMKTVAIERPVQRGVRTLVSFPPGGGPPGGPFREPFRLRPGAPDDWAAAGSEAPSLSGSQQNP